MNTNPKPSLRAIERAEARAKLAERRAQQLKSRVEAAETRAELAETRTEAAKTRTEHAEMRAEKAETRAERAEARAAKAEAMVEKLMSKKTRQPTLAAALSDKLPDPRVLEKLGPRQREILQLIAAGHNTKQMAALLDVSPKTIEYHRLKLMGNLKTFDIPGLVRFALKSGLGPPEE
jgi:DNA-binding CsgD family transcriptional regulator